MSRVEKERNGIITYNKWQLVSIIGKTSVSPLDQGLYLFRAALLG